MIDMRLHEGHCTIKLDGYRINLLADLPIGFGKLLYRVLGDCPKELKDELIKATFEMTLEQMKAEEEGEQA